MCYRCEVCNAVVPPKQPKLTYVVTRTRGDKVLPSGLRLTQHGSEIAREMPVCPDCNQRLKKGMAVNRLVRQYSKRRPEELRVARPVEQTREVEF